MTMVEPIHLLLFGSSSVVSHGNNIVKLDDWYDSCDPVVGFQYCSINDGGVGTVSSMMGLCQYRSINDGVSVLFHQRCGCVYCSIIGRDVSTVPSMVGMSVPLHQ